MKKLSVLMIISVTSLIVLCKQAWADGVDNALESHFFSGFQLGGYASIGLTIPRDQSVEVAVNEISLMLRWESDSRFKFFGELELERPISWNENKRFNLKDTYFDLERFYIDYNLSEKLNLRTGRFLTPAGQWNQLHAPPLVWTSTRPLATSLLFPSSMNGMMLYGSVPLNEHAFEYTFFIEAMKDQVRDDNEIIYKDVGGARFTYNNSMNLGLTLMTFREVEPLRTPSYQMIGLDFYKKFSRLEFSGEAYQRLADEGHDGGGGAYLQSVYALGSEWFLLTRVETFNRPDSGNAERWLFGTTKRLKPNQLLKFEFVGGSGENPDSPRGFLSSFAVLF